MLHLKVCLFVSLLASAMVARADQINDALGCADLSFTTGRTDSSLAGWVAEGEARTGSSGVSCWFSGLSYNEKAWLSSGIVGPCSLVFYYKAHLNTREYVGGVGFAPHGSLAFKVDDEVTPLLSNDDWTRVEVDIPAGFHTLCWVYTAINTAYYYDSDIPNVSLDDVCVESQLTESQTLLYDEISGGLSVRASNYVFQDGALVIPQSVDGKSVVAIGSRAFSNCKSLKSLYVPTTVTQIGDGAFSGCSSLGEVALPCTVTMIGEGIFDGCTALTNLSMGADYRIPDLFGEMGADNVSRFVVADGSVAIADSALAWMSGLQRVEMPQSVISIGRNAFAYCSSLKNVTIGEGVSVIGNQAFLYCTSLEKIEMPQSVRSIGDSAFSQCWSLHHIDINNGVTSIGKNVYSGSPIEWISIPKTISALNADTFTYSVETPESPLIVRIYPGDETRLREIFISRVGVSRWKRYFMLEYQRVDPHHALSAHFKDFSKWAKNRKDYLMFAKAHSGEQDVVTAYGEILSEKGIPRWQEYIMGTDPTDPTDLFTANISFDGEKPVITWNPSLNDEGAWNGIRKYVVYAKHRLSGRDWSLIDEESLAQYNFFKVGIELPRVEAQFPRRTVASAGGFIMTTNTMAFEGLTAEFIVAFKGTLSGKVLGGSQISCEMCNVGLNPIHDGVGQFQVVSGDNLYCVLVSYWSGYSSDFREGTMMRIEGAGYMPLSDKVQPGYDFSANSYFPLPVATDSDGEGLALSLTSCITE